MLRKRRFAKPALALFAAGAVALAVAGCAFVKPGSLTLSQPEGVGAVRVHFVLCTVGGSELCGPNEENATIQYLVGIAVPPGSTPPETFTAAPKGSGTPIVFTRDEEVTPEIAASSVAEQKVLSGIHTPKEEEEEAKLLLGGLWPPNGLQGFGYISAPVNDVEKESVEWNVDANFGLPSVKGAPFAGPFSTGVAFGLRVIAEKAPANRAVHCVRVEVGLKEPEPTDSLCSGSVLEGQLVSNDLRVAAPTKPVSAFVGGSSQISFPLEFAGGMSVPTFALSATTTAKGGKAKLASSSFTPATPNPSTHLSAKGTGKVTVSLPRNIKPGTYDVTLTAKAPQGGTATGVAKLKVTKPKLKLSAAKLNPGNGTATLKVKVPSGGKLTIAGKGVATVTKKSKKAKTIKVTITPSGGASAQLASSGSVKVKVKATFKPTSGISVSKTKSIVLKLG